MSLPNQIAVLERLAEVSKLLDAATDEMAVLDEAAVRAKQSFEVAFSRAFLRSEGAMDLRKHLAVVATGDELLVVELASQQVRACRERIRTLGLQLEVGRSLSAALRSGFNSEGVGQWT